MERLTKTYDDGSFGLANDLPCGENSYDFKDLLINRLGEYEDAEENGLLVRLPCKLGTFVYGISSERGKDDLNVYRTFFGYKDIDQLGKTVFFTKAEAEAKLKEIEAKLKEMEGEDADSD